MPFEMAASIVSRFPVHKADTALGVISPSCFHTHYDRCSLDPGYYRGSRYAEKHTFDDREEHFWLVQHIFDQFSRTPHLMLVMISDRPVDENPLRSEIVAMVSFMLARFRSRSRRKHVLHPVSRWNYPLCRRRLAVRS
jgi:hypothetical protein